ncbi:MAG TPA: protein kinase [Acidobacteriaceae bacterium]|nr:protein kinase [Acidobacteriaceae bacterium]
MSPERLRQIEELYHSARDQGAAVLVDADPELRQEVEKLLAQDSESGSKLLDQSAENLLMGKTGSRVEAGSQLGPYRIKALLGEGGMGQVFRATDTRLGRSVAIKVLKEWTGRFERESRAIAALNHPNICTLHDVGPNYLVMELIVGETLAARLKRGKLSVEQALPLGIQIANALAAAHAQGIIHRDLKPANVMLTKTGVKVLDFGLAKSTTDPSQSAQGLVMGTPAYMAPEQFGGAGADSRTDIYALGLILREMLIGRNSDVWEGIPPALERTVKRCTADEPDERWQSVRDLQWELESIAAAPAPAATRSRRKALLPALGLLGVLAAALGAALLLRNPHTAQPVALLNVLLPEKSRVLSLTVSPDGRAIALVLVKDGQQQIWVRELDALQLTSLEGTAGALNPFWSPDGRSIAFFADAKLKKIDRSGGPVQTLCDALGATGAAWSPGGDILLAGLEGMERVSPAGGAPSRLPENVGVQGSYPYFLPDGDHYLATRQDGIWLGAMRSPGKRQIVPDVSNAQFMAPPAGGRIGAVIFARGSALFALPFDVKRLEPAGDAFAIAPEVAGGPGMSRLAAASNAGVLAWVAGARAGWQYVVRDREGRQLRSYPNAGTVAMISPDGKKLVGDRFDGGLWVLDLGAGTATRLTFGGGFNPVWSADGRYIVYDKIGDGIYRKLASGAKDEELMVKEPRLAVPKSWSPDGKFLVYAQINPGTGADLMAIEATDRKPFPVVQTSATEDQGQFSPDGHWLAYTSNQSGQAEVYVIPFPPSPGAQWLISRGGGAQPRWRPDGKELFYISADSQMMAVDVSTHPTFQSGTPHPLFQSDIVDTGIRTGPISWDLAPDGKRFLVITPNSSETSTVTVALNWRQEAAK